MFFLRSQSCPSLPLVYFWLYENAAPSGNADHRRYDRVDSTATTSISRSTSSSDWGIVGPADRRCRLLDDDGDGGGGGDGGRVLPYEDDDGDNGGGGLSAISWSIFVPVPDRRLPPSSSSPPSPGRGEETRTSSSV